MITDITLFNRYVEGHAPHYQRTYLYKVDWDRPRMALGMPSTVTTLILIPYELTLFYRPPAEWKENREGFWTLQLEDVIVQGIVEAEIDTVTDDLYQVYSLTDLKRKFELVTITDLYLGGKAISQLTFQVGAH